MLNHCDFLNPFLTVDILETVLFTASSLSFLCQILFLPILFSSFFELAFSA
jgi:hypothetical protein